MGVPNSLRAQLASYTPIWIQNTPGFRKLYSFLYMIALMGDTMMQVGYEGLYASYPGVGTPTALPLIGASRGLIQGPAESNAAFATRCINWLTTAREAGSPGGLAQGIQSFLVGAGSLGLGVFPTVRVVDRTGNAVTANPDGTITNSTISWNWDDTDGWVDATHFANGGVVTGYWSDIWVLVSPDPWVHYTTLSDPAWLANWGNPNSPGLGHTVPQGYADGIQTLLQSGLSKGAHTWIRAIIFTADVTTFVPTGVDGNYSANVAGVQTATRDPNSRYWSADG